MKPSTLRLVCLSIFTLVTLWYSFDAITKVYRYTQYGQKASSMTVQYDVVQERSDLFKYRARYSFSYGDTTHEGTAVLSLPRFRNETSAIEYLPEYKDRSLTIWFNADDPSISVIEKSYPYKEIVYALILWGLLIYFSVIGNIMGKQRGH